MTTEVGSPVVAVEAATIQAAMTEEASVVAAIEALPHRNGGCRGDPGCRGSSITDGAGNRGGIAGDRRGNSHRGRDGDVDPHRDARADRNRNRGAHGNIGAHRNGDGNPGSNRYGNGDPGPNGDSNRNAGANRNSNRDSSPTDTATATEEPTNTATATETRLQSDQHRHPGADRDCHSGAHRYGDADPNRDAGAHGHGNADSDRDAGAHGHGDTDSDRDAGAHGYIDPDDRSNPHTGADRNRGSCGGRSRSVALRRGIAVDRSTLRGARGVPRGIAGRTRFAGRSAHVRTSCQPGPGTPSVTPTVTGLFGQPGTPTVEPTPMCM